MILFFFRLIGWVKKVNSTSYSTCTAMKCNYLSIFHPWVQEYETPFTRRPDLGPWNYTLKGFVVSIVQCLKGDPVYRTVALLVLSVVPCRQLALRSTASPGHSASMETFLITQNGTEAVHENELLIVYNTVAFLTLG